jgi:hypothetical protein
LRSTLKRLLQRRQRIQRQIGAHVHAGVGRGVDGGGVDHRLAQVQQAPPRPLH